MSLLGWSRQGTLSTSFELISPGIPYPMPPKRNFDVELATLEALRDASPEAAEPELVKALIQVSQISGPRCHRQVRLPSPKPWKALGLGSADLTCHVES